MTAWPSLAGCVLFSEIAYLDDGEATDRLGRMGFDSVQCFDDVATDTRCYRANREQYDLIGFKGTSSIRDMLIDAQIAKHEWYDSQVHTGFFRAYDSVRNRLIMDLGTRPLLIVGHSLGGAMATLCASDVVHQGFASSANCITFGCPRVGDDAFVMAYNKMPIETTRVVHADDIVPRMPNFGYEHVDGLLHLDDDGKAASGLGNWWRSFRGVDRMLHEEARLALSTIDGAALRDHKLANYAAVVNKYLTKELAHA